MSVKTLKTYQEQAVQELLMKSKLLLTKNIDKKTIIFQSPTGSGKTFMMSNYIRELINEMSDNDLCFLRISIGK